MRVYVCTACVCVCVCMLRICCIVLLLLPPLVQPASSALFWSSLGHKTTTYLLARARLSLSLPPLSLSLLSMCLCESVYSPLVSPGNRFYLAAVCLFACLPASASLSVSLPRVRLHSRSLAVITSFKIKAYIMCLCRYPFMLHSLCLHFIISFTFAT